MSTFEILDGSGSPYELATETNGSTFTPHSAPEINGQVVTRSNPLPIEFATVSPSAATPLTITTGGSSQTLFAAGSVVRGFRVQNPTDATESLYVDDAASASPTSGTSVEVPPGGLYESQFPPTGAVAVYAATTGHAFRAASY